MSQESSEGSRESSISHDREGPEHIHFGFILSAACLGGQAGQVAGSNLQRS